MFQEIVPERVLGLSHSPHRISLYLVPLDLDAKGMHGYAHCQVMRNPGLRVVHRDSEKTRPDM